MLTKEMIHKQTAGVRHARQANIFRTTTTRIPREIILSAMIPPGKINVVANESGGKGRKNTALTRAVMNSHTFNRVCCQNLRESLTQDACCSHDAIAASCDVSHRLQVADQLGCSYSHRHAE